MPNAPRHTVTLLLTDIEDSTGHWAREPATMKAALQQHGEIVHRVVVAHHGKVLKERGEGDSHFCTFDSAAAALAAAIDVQVELGAQAWPTEQPLNARMSVMTCDVNPWDGDLYGPNVNAAFDLRNMALPRHVLVSDSTRSIAQGHLPAGAALVLLGRRALGGMPARQPVYELIHPGLEPEPQPLPGKRPVPVLPDVMIGREDEIERTTDLLAQRRLVTLTGPGGVGKTHLALAVAAASADRFTDGVAFVPLDSLPRGGDVAEAFWTVLGTGESLRGSGMQHVAAQIGSAELLVVVDNCEHVLSRATGAVDLLLTECPNLRVLATSREPLGSPSESELRLRGLPWPPAEQAHEWATYPATHLFMERATRRDPTFTLAPDEPDSIRDIAELLEGHPLAICIAASNAHVLGPRQILEQLRAGLSMHQPSGPSRHESLESCLDWSYGLLDKNEQEALVRLGVFASSFDLDDAAYVLTEPMDQVLVLLSNFASKSLMAAVREPGAPVRYRFPPPLRMYVALRTDPALLLTARDRHAEWSWDRVVERKEGIGEDTWFPRVATYSDDVRAALAHLEGTEDWPSAFRMATSMRPYWFARGLWEEGSIHLERLLVHASGVASGQRAEALTGLGTLLWMRGQPGASVLHRQALELWTQIDDKLGIARAMNNLGTTAFTSGDLVEARSWFEQSYALKSELGITGTTGPLNLGLVLHEQGELVAAEAMLARAVDASRASGQDGLATALLAHGSVLCELRRLDDALTALEAALDSGERIQDENGIAETLRLLALVNLELGMADLARAHLARADALCTRHGWHEGHLENLVLQAQYGLAADPHALRTELLRTLTSAPGSWRRLYETRALIALALIEQDTGSGRSAALRLRSALGALAEMGHPVDTVWALETAAHFVADSERDVAAQIVAACDDERARMRAPRPSYSDVRVRSLPPTTSDVSRLAIDSALELAESALDRVIDAD